MDIIDGAADRLDVYAEEQREQAAYWREDAAHLARMLAKVEGWVAEREGRAAGYAFRAAELRYDARGGMTVEQCCGPVGTERLRRDFLAQPKR